MPADDARRVLDMQTPASAACRMSAYRTIDRRVARATYATGIAKFRNDRHRIARVHFIHIPTDSHPCFSFPLAYRDKSSSTCVFRENIGLPNKCDCPHDSLARRARNRQRFPPTIAAEQKTRARSERRAMHANRERRRRRRTSDADRSRIAQIRIRNADEAQRGWNEQAHTPPDHR
ncbi:hypothetical protein [Burkholderia mayonis]|uniref:hypothetical protein n=1 Tax=Burkholderia mayonis TaxID=1385591 RepID=UPI00131F2E93|nr:hypothetical protein [Burkholderia mayonis]